MSDDKEFKPKGEDEIRQEVIDTHKLNAEEQKELIDGITKDKLSQQEALGTAIRQKKDWRQKASDFEKGKNFYKKNPPKNQPPQPSKETGETNQEYEKRLSDLEIATIGEASEEIAKEVKRVKKLEPDKSFKEIYNSDYIQFKVEKEKDAKAIDDASISPDGKQTEQLKQNFKGMSITDFNKKYNPESGKMTEEVSVLYEKWKKDNT